MSVRIPALVQTDHTAVQNVVQCLSLTTKTLGIVHLAPLLQINFSG